MGVLTIKTNQRIDALMAEVKQQFQSEGLKCDTGLIVVTLPTGHSESEIAVCLTSWGSPFAIDGLVESLSNGSIYAGGWLAHPPNLELPPE